MPPEELKRVLLSTPWPNDYWKVINEALYELMSDEFYEYMQDHWNELAYSDANFDLTEADLAEE